MANPELIITGWPRGGLGYVVELLRLSGVVVGQTFDANTTNENVEERLRTAKAVEVSPFVVPWLARDELRNTRVVFVTRDPMRILNSFHFHGLFHEEKMSAVKQIAYRTFSNFKAEYRGKPIQASAAYITNWYSLALAARTDLTKLPVEEGPHHLLSVLFPSWSGVIPFCLPEVNSSNCRQILVPSQLPGAVGKFMLLLLMHLGYHTKFWYPCGGHAHYTNADWHC